MRKIFYGVLCILCVALMSRCGTKSGESTNESGASTGKNVVLKLGHAMSEGTNATKLIHEFAEKVSEETEGRVVIEDFPNGQLGSETEMLEQIHLGVVDSGAIMCGSMQSLEPKMAIEDLPYMWKDEEHARNAYDGEFGEHLGNLMAAHGMTKIGYVEWGYRQITNNSKPIRVPEDLKGIKIRVAQNKLRVDAFEQVGALPIMLAFSELYGALQQGVVDAQENPLSNIAAANFNEVQEYLSITDHFYNQAMLVVNTQKWNEIGQQDQETILKLAKELSDKVKMANDNDEQGYLKTLEEKGMEINSDVDKEAFREAMKPVYSKWEEIFGPELMDVYNAVSGW